MFRYYTDAVSQASKGIAQGVFAAGGLLIGLGVLIIALPAIFAAIVAGLLFIAGLGLCITAIKIFISVRRLSKNAANSDEKSYRQNVQIHIEEDNVKIHIEEDHEL